MTRPENSRRGGSCRIAIRSRSSSTTGYSLETVASHRPAPPRMRLDREPHIGEYDVKTNAVCAFPHTATASGPDGEWAYSDIWLDADTAFIVRGFSAPDRRPWSAWDDFAAGRPER